MQSFQQGIQSNAYMPAQTSFSLDGFASWLRDSGVADNTVRSYLSRLNNFSSFMQKQNSASASTDINVVATEYLQALRNQDKAASSLRSFCVALTSYCQFKQLPRPHIQVKAPPAPAAVLMPAHQERLLDILRHHCSDRDRAMIGAMLLLGLRTGECVRANLADLYVENEIVMLAVRSAGGDITRSVAFTSEARHLLGPWIVSRRRMVGVTNSALFISVSAERVHPNTVRWTVGKVASLIGIQISPQMLRNTWKEKLI